MRLYPYNFTLLCSSSSDQGSAKHQSIYQFILSCMAHLSSPPDLLHKSATHYCACMLQLSARQWSWKYRLRDSMARTCHWATYNFDCTNPSRSYATHNSICTKRVNLVCVTYCTTYSAVPCMNK